MLSEQLSPSNQLQIRNTVQLACALASQRNDVLSYTDLQMVLEWGEEFHHDFEGHGAIDAINSYT